MYPIPPINQTDMLDRIRQWCEKHQITEVEALMPDITGVARGKIMPAEKYCEDGGIHLPEAITIQTVNGDCPQADDTVHPRDGDILLRGDANTIRFVPWTKEPTAQIIHDCFHRSGKAVEASSRYVLRRVLELYAERGWKPIVAPELEFYLVKPNPDADYPLEPPIGLSGRPESGRQPYGIDALNEYEPFIEDLYDYSEAQGIELDTVIHEAGAAQIEINLLHGDPLELADQTFLFKRTARQAALKHQTYATFMAKPIEKEPGSSMHLHQNVIDTKTGHNVFTDAAGEASPLFFSHIAGLQQYLPLAMALLAPNVNSYRRITRYNAAPINVHWGYDNRTTGLRIPISEPHSRRIENRIAGADANPYLAIAASLICGYLGMADNLKPSAPIDHSAYQLPYQLPPSLAHALQNLITNERLTNALGKHFINSYKVVKECELNAFFKVISSWEREYLLLCV